MSGLDGLGWPEEMTAASAVNTLKFIADDHPCCAHALKEIVLWLDSLLPIDPAVEIIKKTLREIPVGYIPKHIADNLPAMVAEMVAAVAKAEPFRDALKEIYNTASFDWDTMPEDGKKRFREVVQQMAGDALNFTP